MRSVAICQAKYIHQNSFQTPLCTASNLECLSNVKVDNQNCLQKCSGLMVTSYDQQEIGYESTRQKALKVTKKGDIVQVD